MQLGEEENHMSESVSSSDEEYERLMALEDLETLLEDLEEQGITGLGPPQVIPAEMRARFKAAGVENVLQLRDKLMHLHAELDDDPSELTISDS
jgi:hypothetical protein